MLPLVELKNISLAFKGKTVFKELSYQIFPLDHLALMGPNGSGKSSLLKLIAGEMRLPQIPCFEELKDNGSITWGFGEKMESSALVAKDKVRLVSPAQQENYVLQKWNISGEEIILSGFYNTPLLYSQASDHEIKICHELAEKAQLQNLLSLKAPAMSQGQLRAMLILRALVDKPPLLLLDEPLEGLDFESEEILRKLMLKAPNFGSTLVITGHRPEHIPAESFKLVKMGESQISPLDPEELTNTPKSTLKVKDELKEILELHRERSRELIPDNEPFLKMEKVDVFINRKLILKDINWSAHKGEHWLIRGGNGAGKSTLMRLAHGEEFVAYGGKISWFKRKVIPLQELAINIGYVSDRLQNLYTYNLSAHELILSGYDGSIGLYREMSREEKARAEVWISYLKIREIIKQNFRSLSSGQARRVLLARALASAPPVLLLDEAFSGLDHENRDLWMSILPLLAEHGVHIILCSHHDDGIKDLFTHEIYMEEGKIISQGKI